MSNIKIGIKMCSLAKTTAKKDTQWKVTDDNVIQSVNDLYPCTFKFGKLPLNAFQKWVEHLCVKSFSNSNPTDHIFGPDCLNYDVYSLIVKPVVKLCLDGHNGTILLYGQTSSGASCKICLSNTKPDLFSVSEMFFFVGKSYTMMGTERDPGIQLLAIEQIFKRESISPDLEFNIRWEIVNSCGSILLEFWLHSVWATSKSIGRWCTTS